MSRTSIVLPLLLVSACGLEHPLTRFPTYDAGTPPVQPPDSGVPDESCEVAWQGDLQMNSGLDDEATDLWIDPDGTLFVTGYERGLVGVSNLEPAGNSVGVVHRISPSGRPLQTIQFETGGADVVESITRDATTGRLVVAGRTTGAFPGQTNAGQFDSFVAMLNEAGDIQHLTQDGTNAPQHPRRIQTLPGGRLFVGGSDDMFVPTNYVERWEDPFVSGLSFDERRHDALMRDWWTPFATPGSDLGNDLAVDASGIYLAGMTAAGQNKGPFIRKLALDGTPLWWKSVRGGTGDSMNAVLMTPQGKLYAAGTSFMRIGDHSYGQQDAFVMALEPATGNLVRAMQFGSPNSEWVTAMTSDAEGNLYVAGVSDESLRPGRVHQGYGDAFVIRFDAQGRVTGLAEWGTAGEDWITALRIDTCGRVFAVGFTETMSSSRRDMFVKQVRIEPYMPANGGPHTQVEVAR